MKKLAFLMVLVVVFVGLMAGSAFATRYDSTYQTPSAASPHGQYDTTTYKCSVCHAVHNPGGLGTATPAVRADDANRDVTMGTSEVLLRSTIANACLYCHVSATFAIKTVYAENTANYQAASGFAHGTNGGVMDNTGVNCTDCHQVHGASLAMATTADTYMYSKILKLQPSYDASAPAFVASNTGVVNGDNMSRWCSGCHVYYATAHNSNSHIMGAANAAYNNPASTFTGRAAWTASTYCRSCHANGNTDQLAAANGANNFPHFTTGFRFLNEATSSAVAASPATSNNDGTCLICHAGAAAGVGMNF